MLRRLFGQKLEIGVFGRKRPFSIYKNDGLEINAKYDRPVLFNNSVGAKMTDSKLINRDYQEKISMLHKQYTTGQLPYSLRDVSYKLMQSHRDILKSNGRTAFLDCVKFSFYLCPDFYDHITSAETLIYLLPYVDEPLLLEMWMDPKLSPILELEPKSDKELFFKIVLHTRKNHVGKAGKQASLGSGFVSKIISKSAAFYGKNLKTFPDKMDSLITNLIRRNGSIFYGNGDIWISAMSSYHIHEHNVSDQDGFIPLLKYSMDQVEPHLRERIIDVALMKSAAFGQSILYGNVIAIAKKLNIEITREYVVAEKRSKSRRSE